MRQRPSKQMRKKIIKTKIKEDISQKKKSKSQKGGKRAINLWGWVEK